VKIGLLATDFITWGGGVDFLRLIVDSLLASPRSQDAEFHLLIPDAGPKLAWRRIRGRAKQTVKSLFSGKALPPQHAPSPEVISQAFSEFRDRITIHHIDIGRGALMRAVKRLELGVVLPAVHSLGTDFPRPWVGYAYDFQHKYFPQHFTPNDCRSRDEHFAEMLTQAKTVIVNSRAAAADITKFVPQATARVVALPFAPAPGRDWLEDRPNVLPRYDVTQPFFIISNQFWIHKDHATAFEAFRIVAEHDPRIKLVCTGSTVDSRNPDYFPGLLSRVKSWGLDQRVHILGLMPKRDQIEIMKHACAVIQTTLFEGGPGGGAVYDAVSLDVPAIVSDIPVNRELEAPAIEFFPAGDAVALAAKMKARLLDPHTRAPGSDLISVGQRRRAACGDVIWESINSVL
jgi:glycosyltransferase involved in cell wall biosynthesis